MNISNVNKKFEMSTMLNEVDKSVLLTVPNPRYEELMKRYRHLEGMVMDDIDEKSEFPVHVILHAGHKIRKKRHV